MNKRGFLLVLASLMTLLQVSSLVTSTSVVINSKDWKTVYSALFYASYNSYDAYYLTSSNPEGFFRLFPMDPNVILIQDKSPDKRYIPNFEGLLKVRGINVDLREVEDASLELIPDGVKKVYVVESDFPFASVAVAPLARIENGWVVLVGDENVNRVVSSLSGMNVVLVGQFKRNIKDSLSSLNVVETLPMSNKYELSKAILEKYLEKKPTKQVLITDGWSLEPELFRGKNPIILVGKNVVPKDMVDYLMKKGIKTVVVIGPELTYVGEQIRLLSNKKISVFIKFGQALSGGPIYALSLYPIPKPELRLSIGKVVYDPNAKRILIFFKNDGNTGLFVFTTFRIVDANGNEVASGGDAEPVFLGSGESVALSYEVEIPGDKLSEDLYAEMYASYGISADNMEYYLTSKGKYGPPLKLPVEISNINDESEVELSDLVYLSNSGKFLIKVKNVGNVDAYVRVKIIDLSVGGIKNSYTSDVIFLPAGEEKDTMISVKMDDFDIKSNDFVNVLLVYGQNKDALVKSKSYKKELVVSSALLISGHLVETTHLLIIGVVVVIIVLAVIFLRRSSENLPSHKVQRQIS